MYERPEQSEMLRALNVLHAKVYEERRRELEEQLNCATLEFAMAQLKSDARRGIPFNHWSFQAAVVEGSQAVAKRNAQITQAVADRIREFARKGGSSRKTDALQEIIINIVYESPNITDSRLLQQLRHMQHGDVIDDIDDTSEPDAAIHFMDRNSKSKEAPLSGLKDRLSRAKKEFSKTNSRKADSAN